MGKRTEEHGSNLPARDDAKDKVSPKVTVVSCFKSGASYAQAFLDGLDKWPSDVEFRIYHHDGPLPPNAPQADNIKYKSLNEVDAMVEFRRLFPTFDGTMGGQMQYNWRLDAQKFSHKVFALLDASDCNGIMLWVDADTKTIKPITLDFLMPMLPVNEDITHLERKEPPYSETSWVGFNMDRPASRYLLADLVDLYMSGELFHYREWHDGFAFERLLALHKQHGLIARNLNPDLGQQQAFEASPLSEYMIHYKGALKNYMGPQRYNHLVDLARHFKPKVIAETGTNSGIRAIDMARAVLQTENEVHYDGFDLFERATAETDNKEMNTKQHFTVDEVSHRLEQFAKQMVTEGKKFTFKLHRGDTNKTLKTYEGSPDFVFIDGGHSAETVSNDFSRFISAKVMVLDDYFSADEDGNGPPEEHCGTNALIEGGLPTFAPSTWDFHILPSEDKVMGGGITHLVVRLEKGTLPPDLRKKLVPMVVKPVDCVEKEDLALNIRANLEMIDEWVDNCRWNDELVMIASGGPSLEDYIPRIKETLRDIPRTKLVCVKHSYPTLLKAGLRPWACVILDPRPIDGISTHGIIRRELFKEIDRDTIFFVASMTDPGVTKYLKERGARIVGWHAFSQSSMKLPELRNKTLITGGTCAALRSIGVLHTLGFRAFDLYGYDSSIEGEPTNKEEVVEDSKPKWFKVQVNGREFWTTGELIAQAQDFQDLIKREEVDIEINVHGRGIVQEIFNMFRRPLKPTYKELLNV